MENEKYRKILEASADQIEIALAVMFQAADADTERLKKYLATYGDLFYRAPNTDTPTDIVMLPLMATQAPKLKSLVDSLEAIQEKLHGKPASGEGLSKGAAPEKPKEQNDDELKAMGFKMD